MVFPVTITQKNGSQQSAHTLDVSETSARLGGLSLRLEPGEIIAVQHGNSGTKFQVFWMGDPASAMEGQAGIRSLEPGKAIWGLSRRTGSRGSTISSPRPGEKRGYTRLECTGAASVLSEGARYPVQGQIKDVSQGGVYIEITTPLPVGTEVFLKISLAGLALEAHGVVRTSYPMVGMGISFRDMSQENVETLDTILDELSFKNGDGKLVISPDRETADATRFVPVPILHLESRPVQLLSSACQTVAVNFDEWKAARTPEELAEILQVVRDLYRKLSQVSSAEVPDRPDVSIYRRRDTA